MIQDQLAEQKGEETISWATNWDANWAADSHWKAISTIFDKGKSFGDINNFAVWGQLCGPE